MASTGWFAGLAKVLSITDSTPAARQAAAIAATSRQRSVGLIGDSNQTMRVFGPMISAGARNWSRVAKRVVMPNFAARPVST